jgi:hypothetical protein
MSDVEVIAGGAVVGGTPEAAAVLLLLLLLLTMPATGKVRLSHWVNSAGA